MVSRTDKLTQMGRRRFIETLAGLGMSTGVLTNISQEKLEEITDDPTEEVPRVKALHLKNPEAYEETPFPNESEREPEFYTIPREKWIKVETAFDAAHRLQNRVSEIDDSGLVDVGVRISDKGRLEQYGISITRRTVIPLSTREDNSEITAEQADSLDEAKTADVSLDELMGSLPDTAEGQVGNEDYETASRDGIPIHFENSVIADETCPDIDCHNNDDTGDRLYTSTYRYTVSPYTYVGTGCSIHISSDNFGSSSSLGPRVAHNNNNEIGFLTTGHGAFDDTDPEEAIGRDVSQFTTSNQIGTVSHIKHNESSDVSSSSNWDIAFIEMNDSLEAGNRLADVDSGFSGRLGTSILGYDYLKDDEGPVCQQGRRTGRCEQEIYEIIEGESPTQIELYRDQEEGGGNSGGPYFVNEANDEDDLRVAGVHRAGGTRGGNDVAIGMWIGDIEDNFDVTVI
ncbi:hypothetical protein ACLI4Z_17825 [Natrialbaceae archaeon A-arb3/5]